MKKATTKILFLILACLSFNLSAQVTSYTMTPSSGIYTPIVGTTVTLAGGGLDDGWYSSLPIGFTFNYLGTPYTTITPTTNGSAVLGAAVAVSMITNDLNAGVPRPVLAPLWDDLDMVAGSVSYITTGTPGSQIFTLQWSAVSWNYTADADVISFQVKLYEQNSTIQFIYSQGPAALAGTPSASIGITSTGTGAGNYLSLNNSSAAPTVSSTAETTNISTKPATGQIYTFSLPPIDGTLSRFVSPVANSCYTNSEAVSVRFRNNGLDSIDFVTNNLTVNVNVTGAVTTLLTTTITDNSLNAGIKLAPGDSLDITAGTIDMTTTGTYTFASSITLVGDGNSGNNTLAAVNRVVSAGTFNVDFVGCDGTPVSFSLVGGSGAIQWQQSPDNVTWANIPGATTNPYTYISSIGQQDTLYFRAVSCNVLISNVDSIAFDFTAPPSVTDTSRCGIGPLALNAGGPNVYWFTQASGGNVVGTGNTLNTNLTHDSTFYVQNGLGTAGHLVTLVGGNGFNANMFGVHALNTVTITGFEGHTNSTGNTSWDIWYRPNDYLLTPGANTSNAGWTQLGTATGVTGMGTGNSTPIPVNFTVTIPAGSTYSFYVAETSGAGLVYTDGTSLGAVYNSNGLFEVMQGHGGDLFNLTNSPRVFNGIIKYVDGCASVRIPMNVDVTPAPAINFTASDNSICDVDTITLTTTSAAAYTYTYSPSTYLSDTTGSSITAWPQNDITYIVSASEPSGCLITDTLSITVDPTPTGTLAVSDSIVCSGSPVDLTFNSTAGGVFSMTGPAVNIVSNLTVTSSITVSNVQNSLQPGDLVSVCLDITHTFDGDLDLYIQSPLGTMVELSTDNGGLDDNYTNTCFTMTAVTPITLGTAPFTGDYLPEGDFNTFNGENANGTWTLNVGDDAAGDIGTLNSWSITFGNITHPIVWTSVPTGFTSTADSNVVTPLVSTTYNVTVTDTTSGCSRSYSQPIQVNALPVLSLGPDTALCSNYAGITLNGTINAAAEYTWQDGQNSATYFVSLPGTYYVNAIDTNGCSNADTVIVTTVYALVVSIDANLTSLNSATLNAGGGFSSYLWSTSATTQSINVTNNGAYYVTCIDQNGCVSTDTMNIVFSLGVFNTNGSETTMQLYPNPSNGNFNVSINNLETTDLVVNVIDMNGKMVYNQVVGTVSGSAILPFNLTGLSAGTYNMQFIANGKTSTMRFIVGQQY